MGATDVLICRICLVTDVKMYSLENDPYKIYKETIGFLNSDPRIDLKHVCYECAAILVKFSKLVDKSLKAQSALSGILGLYQQITENTVKSINRHVLKLNSTLIHHHINPSSTIKLEYVKDQSPEGFNETEVKDEDKLPVYNEDSSDYVNNRIMFVATPNIKEEPEFCTEEIFVDVPVYRKPINEVKTKSSPKTREKSSRKKSKLKVKPQKTNAKSDAARSPKADGEPVKKRRPKTIDAQILKCFDIVTLTHEEQVAELRRRKESPLYASAPYKCEVCYKCYQHPDSYNNHMLEHSVQHGAHECEVCKKRFKLSHVYLRHRGAHQRQYRCKLCDYVCQQRQAHNHMNTHEGFKVTFKCKHCEFVTDTESLYLSHRRAHRGAASCARCGRGFITPRGLALHRTRGHCTQEDLMTIEEHPCLECDISFMTEKALRVHLRTSKKHADKDKSNICGKCSEVFASRSELTRHCGQAHPAYPKQCNYCATWLPGGPQARAHLRAAHPSLPPRPPRPPPGPGRRPRAAASSPSASAAAARRTRSLCELCGQGFKSLSELEAHSLRHGGGFPRRQARQAKSGQARSEQARDERKYVCELCSRCFKLKTNLTRHMVVHTGARPHACPQCEARFTQAGSRDLHVRTVHYRQPHPPRRRRPAMPT